MEPQRRKPEKAAVPGHFAYAVVLLIAFTGFLWLIPVEFRGSQKLSIESYGIEKLIASHLYHADGIHLASMLLVLVPVGLILERRCWGTLRFLAFFAFTALGSSVVTLVTAFIVGDRGASCGASGVAIGSLVALGYCYPEHKLTWWMPKTKHLVWMLVFLNIALLAFIDRRYAASAERFFLFPQSSGAVLALAFLVLDPWVVSRVERWKLRREEERREKVVAIRDRVDELLGKITEEGYDGLTRDEQTFLRQASKHYKTK